MYDMTRGTFKIGVFFTNNSVSLGLYTTRANKVLLEIYKDKDTKIPFIKTVLDEKYKENNIFGIEIQDLKEGMSYVWRIVKDDYSCSSTILDPYTTCAVFTHGEWRNILKKNNLSMSINKPYIPWEKTIIYELHVGHFTKDCMQIKQELRGTFLGLKEKLSYLKNLGITTIELLPIFKWFDETIKNDNPDTGERLKDVWGYNPISFFQIDERYSVDKTSEGAIKDMRDLVEAAHKEGIEIVLDVVYNHTGEGGKDGRDFNFKNLAPEVYYKISDNNEFMNCSGTGNTFNTNHKIAKSLVIDSMMYWTEVIGVDGFRFDLASILEQDDKGRWDKNGLLTTIANHPVLSKIKLISESWDAKGSYDVGRMPGPFREWSDYFRDSVRQFIKGDQGRIKAIADCLQGKEIYFSDIAKANFHMIHLITAHDGFTLWDLVSYNEKHNRLNGEDGRDGHNANYSYNWGVEGESTDLNIVKTRKKVIKNLISILLLSKGVPMILMGDEAGRTQFGNNNAFCQDNKTVWFDWNRALDFDGQYKFVKRLIELRNTLDYFNETDSDLYNLSWHGIFNENPDWSYCSRSIACLIEGKQTLFLIANSYHENLEFEIPYKNETWIRLIDTEKDDINECIEEKQVKGNKYKVKPYSICLFKLSSSV